MASDFVDSNDELWHWMQCLSQVCKVILVRTKCLSPSQELGSEVEQHFPTNPPPVVSLLARDMQLNPKGGGAVVEGYGMDDLARITEETLRSKQTFAESVIAKLQKQAIRFSTSFTTPIFYQVFLYFQYSHHTEMKNDTQVKRHKKESY